MSPKPPNVRLNDAGKDIIDLALKGVGTFYNVHIAKYSKRGYLSLASWQRLRSGGVIPETAREFVDHINGLAIKVDKETTEGTVSLVIHLDWNSHISPVESAANRADDLDNGTTTDTTTDFGNLQPRSDSQPTILGRPVPLDPCDEKGVEVLCEFLSSMDVTLHDNETLLLRRLFSESRIRIPKVGPRFYLRVSVFRELLLVAKENSEKLAKSQVWQWNVLVRWLFEPVPSTRARTDRKLISSHDAFLNTYVIQCFQYGGLSDGEDNRITGDGLRKRCTGVLRNYEDLVLDLRSLMRHSPRVRYGKHA